MFNGGNNGCLCALFVFTVLRYLGTAGFGYGEIDVRNLSVLGCLQPLGTPRYGDLSVLGFLESLGTKVRLCTESYSSLEPPSSMPGDLRGHPNASRFCIMGEQVFVIFLFLSV